MRSERLIPQWNNKGLTLVQILSVWHTSKIFGICTIFPSEQQEWVRAVVSLEENQLYKEAFLPSSGPEKFVFFPAVLWSDCLPVIASVFVVGICLTSGWIAKSAINIPTHMLAQCPCDWQKLHSPSPLLYNLLSCDALLFKQCFCIYSMGSPTSHVIQGSMISFSFINVETEAWKYGVYPRSVQQIQPTFTSTVECFLYPREFSKWLFFSFC